MITKHTLSRLAIITVAMLAIPASAAADLIVTLQPTTQTLNVGSSGFLDVFVTGSSATGDPVTGYTISLLGESGISYTNVTTATTAADGYIFPNSAGLVVDSTSPDVSYNDFSLTTPTNVVAGETYGVGRISFDAVAAGTYTIDFNTGQNGFIRADFSEIPTTYTGSTINILPAAVPEPTTTLLLILTGIGGLFFARFRSRRLPEPTVG